MDDRPASFAESQSAQVDTSIRWLRQEINLPRVLGQTFENDGELRSLLDYDVRSLCSVAEYLASLC